MPACKTQNHLLLNTALSRLSKYHTVIAYLEGRKVKIGTHNTLVQKRLMFIFIYRSKIKYSVQPYGHTSFPHENVVLHVRVLFILDAFLDQL